MDTSAFSEVPECNVMVSDSKLWESFSDSTCLCDNLDTFKSKLMTYIFEKYLFLIEILILF